MDDRGRLVADGYDAIADRYERLETPERPWPRTRWPADLLERLPDGGHVLDLGCGAGAPAAVEIARHHRVTRLDISPEQIARARVNVPDGDYRVGDALEIDLPEAAFDAVVSFYALSHLPRERHAELLGRIHRWLRPGGWLLLSSDTADRPTRVGEWLGVEMFFSSFDADTTRRLVADAGFEIAETAVETQLEEGREVDFLWILARRPEDPATAG
jgi:SAM-dependent methyltransferase